MADVKKTLLELLPLGDFCVESGCHTPGVYEGNLIMAQNGNKAERKRGEENIKMQISNCHANCKAYHLFCWQYDLPQ